MLLGVWIVDFGISFIDGSLGLILCFASFVLLFVCLSCLSQSFCFTMFLVLQFLSLCLPFMCFSSSGFLAGQGRIAGQGHLHGF